MGASQKSFFSSVPGILTGTAGVVCAVAAVAGLAVQQGWIGGDSGGSQATGTTAPGRSAQDGSGATDGARARPTYSVSPTSLSFRPAGDSEANVKVVNTGEVSLRVQDPSVTGDDADRFEASRGSCDQPVEPGRSCELNVRFMPRTGTFEAILVVTASGAARATEVPLRATGLL